MFPFQEAQHMAMLLLVLPMAERNYWIVDYFARIRHSRNDIKYTIGPIKKKGCKTIKWDKKLMDGLKGSVVSQIDGEYNTKDNTIALTIWIKIGWVPAVALHSTMKNVPHAIGPY